MPRAGFVTLPGGVHSQDSYRPELVLPYASAFWRSLGTRGSSALRLMCEPGLSPFE